MKEKLNCLSVGPPVSPTALPDCGKDSPIQGAIWPLNLSGWLTAQMSGGPSGKMSRAYYRAEADAILPASYRSSADGKSQSLKKDGENQELSLPPQDVSAWHGEFATANIQEFPRSRELFPNGEEDSSWSDTVASLSEILLTGSIPQRYFLTAKCATGILRRAERRGKTLPPLLLTALQKQAVCAE